MRKHFNVTHSGATLQELFMEFLECILRFEIQISGFVIRTLYRRSGRFWQCALSVLSIFEVLKLAGLKLDSLHFVSICLGRCVLPSIKRPVAAYPNGQLRHTNCYLSFQIISLNLSVCLPSYFSSSLESCNVSQKQQHSCLQRF